MRVLRIALLPMALVLAACSGAGSGNLVTEQREVPAFESLEISSGIDVVLTVDSGADQSVSVTFDDNLVDNVVTEVSGRTLVVEMTGSFTTFGGGRFVTVTADSLKAISISGGSDIKGAGSIEQYSLDASGGSDADLRDLTAAVVEVNVSGGADALVYARESITGSASGGSDVTVYGDPANGRVDVSGGADVDYAG